MAIKKLVKVTGIGLGLYTLANVSFLYGKGCTLRLMKECNATVDEALDALEYNIKTDSLCKRLNGKFIKMIVKSRF